MKKAWGKRNEGKRGKKSMNYKQEGDKEAGRRLEVHK